MEIPGFRIQGMIKEVDENKNDTIELEEFIEVILNKTIAIYSSCLS